MQERHRLIVRKAEKRESAPAVKESRNNNSKKKLPRVLVLRDICRSSCYRTDYLCDSSFDVCLVIVSEGIF